MITVRHYRWPDDFEAVGSFLKQNMGERILSTNWTQARWEYMHYHPYIKYDELHRIGIFLDGGEIVGVIHHEHTLGEVYTEVKRGYEYLREDMISYAEEHLSVETKTKHQRLRVYVNDFDEETIALMKRLGYHLKRPVAEPISVYTITKSFRPVPLPEGFSLVGLNKDDDFCKLDRLLWRGFNHEGEPPKSGVEGMKLMQSSPHYNKELNIVVQNEMHHYCAYAGIWYDDVNKLGYIEPVCTDPDYRRMGLGRAAVLEGIMRCKSLGATIAKVGSNQPFYLSIGFKEIYSRELWSKTW